MSIDIGHIQEVKEKKILLTKEESSMFKHSFFASKKLNDKNKAFIYKDLVTLLDAGVDFKTALTILRDQQKSKTTHSVIDNLLAHVIRGKALFEAMEMTGQFTPYEIFSVKIGEETRQLEAILKELQKYFQRKLKLKKQITSILTYPVFILALTFATLYFMLTYVVPLFESVFNQFDKELPLLTKYVIALSENFSTIMTVILLTLLGTWLIYRKVKNKIWFQKSSSRFLMRIPFFGKLIKEIYLTRFCQSMALLLTSKTSLLEALDLVQKMIRFYPIESALTTVKQNITRGDGLGDSLSKFSIFKGTIISMVKVAEQVNQLDTMFLNMANQFDEEVEHKTKMMGSIIEPMLILFIGGIVGVIMISMYAPMFDLSKVIGGN